MKALEFVEDETNAAEAQTIPVCALNEQAGGILLRRVTETLWQSSTGLQSKAKQTSATT